MTKTELAKSVAENTGLSKQKALETMDTVFRVIAETLEQGEKVQIVGFGTFNTK